MTVKTIKLNKLLVFIAITELAGLFGFLLGGSPVLCQNGIEIDYHFDAILYKRSSSLSIPFSMPYFKLFYFQLI